MQKRKLMKFQLLLLMLFLTSSSFSQTHSLGISYEPSVVTSSLPDIYYYTNPPRIHTISARFGNSFGIDYIILSKANTFGIKSGIYFIDYGYNEKITREEPFFLDRTDHVFYKYFSLPIELHKSFNNYYVNFGPNFNFLIISKSNLETGESIIIEDRHFAFGLKTEVGYKFKITELLGLNISFINRLILRDERYINYGIVLSMNYKI